MTTLDALISRLQHAASKPPEAGGRKVMGVATKTLMAAVRDSQGRNRPVVRQTLAQQRALRDQATGQVTQEEVNRVTAEAKDLLT